MPSAIAEARRALADMARDSIAGEENGEIAILIRDGDEGPVLLRVTLTTSFPEDRTGQQF